MIQFLFVLCFCLVAGSATMKSADFYLRINGIDGEIMDPELSGAIELESFSFGVLSPRDAASGLATGRRQHKPVTFSKRIDKASPLLFRALATGEHIKDVIITLRRPGATGQVETYMTITFEDVLISSMITHGGDVDGDGLPDVLEEVSFTYQSMRVLHVPSRTEATDTWRQQ